MAADEPLYVVHKDARTNTVTVGPKNALRTRAVQLDPLVLHRPAEEVTHVKLRYRAEPVPCHLRPATCDLHLDDPFEAATPGQTAVLLRDQQVIGWGRIVQPSNTVPVSLPLAESAHV